MLEFALQSPGDHETAIKRRDHLDRISADWR
jgi:hypothetical protein